MTATASRAQQLMDKLKKGDTKTSSSYNVRSEHIASNSRVRKIPRYKYEAGVYHKMLFPFELAFPMDPSSGEVTDEFNEINKYRPLAAATDMAITAKMMADMGQGFKAELMRRAGVEEWDTSDHGVLTELDQKIFLQYLQLRTFSSRVVTVNSKEITGKDYGQDYAVDLVRDELGNFEGEIPVYLKINKLYRDIAHNKANHYRELRKIAKDGGDWKSQSKVNVALFEEHKLSSISDDKFNEVYIGPIYRDQLVSEDHASNAYVVFCFELNGGMKFKSDEEIDALDADGMRRAMRIIKASKGLREAFEQFKIGLKYHESGWNWDFLEIDASGPSSYEGNNPQRDIPKEYTFEGPIKPLKTSQHNSKIMSLFYDVQNNNEGLDDRYVASMNLRKMDKSVEDKLLDVLVERKLLESGNPFISAEVISHNQDILILAYGDKARDEITSVEIGVSDFESSGLNSEEEDKNMKMTLGDALNDEDAEDTDLEEETNQAAENPEHKPSVMEME